MIVQLTEESRRLQGVYEEASSRMTDAFYDGFAEDEMQQTECLLQRILDNLLRCEEENKG